MSEIFTETEQETINVIDKQLEAYNARDIDAFSATYHDDVEIHSYSAGLQYRGKDILIEEYGKFFKNLKYLKGTSLKRIVHGQFLVDHELVESSSETEGVIDRNMKAIAVYEVVDGLIKRVSFMG